jgi:PTS system mannose-specific IIB component/fructoselysine and glucoselysine-specific PTS system IIB component
VAIELFRIDDRLIHGQVIVGWGQPMGLAFLALVDDEVAASEWEQELYRMAVPPEVELVFATVAEASRCVEAWMRDPRPGIVLTGDVGTMRRLTERAALVREVNIGGLHFRAGRAQRLRYVFLTPDEERDLLSMEEHGVRVSARDVPAARAIPLGVLLAGEGAA